MIYQSGRYDDYGEEMLRIKDRQNREMLYGPTNEELITEIFRASIKSYKSLPQLLWAPDVYQGSPTSVTAFFAIKDLFFFTSFISIYGKSEFKFNLS